MHKSSNAINFRQGRSQWLVINKEKKIFVFNKKAKEIKPSLKTYSLSYGSLILKGIQANHLPLPKDQVNTILEITKIQELMGDIATKRQVVKRYVIKVYADPYILQSINVSSTKIEVIHGGWTELDVQPKTFTGNNLIHNILDIPIE
jgi:hypothetical protein